MTVLKNGKGDERLADIRERWRIGADGDGAGRVEEDVDVRE